MTNLEAEIAKAKAKAKAEYKSKMRRLKAAQNRHDDRVKQVIVKILEGEHPELYSQLWSAAERDLERQAQARANAKRDAKSQLSQPENGEHREQGQSEQNA